MSKENNFLTNDEELKIGFIMRKARTESAAQQDLEKTIEKGQCILG